MSVPVVRAFSVEVCVSGTEAFVSVVGQCPKCGMFSGSLDVPAKFVTKAVGNSSSCVVVDGHAIPTECCDAQCRVKYCVHT